MKSRLALLAVCCLALSACGTMSKLWPFGKKAKPGPEIVNELKLVNADGQPASYPQYWKRNTLVIDLSGVSGAGSVAARLPEETSWPVRMAVRVRPGSIGMLEVQGEERNVLPVSNLGVDNIDLELAASVYRPQTAAIYISWGAMPVFAEAAAPVGAPAFVSPTEVPATPPPPAESTPSAPPAAPAATDPAQPSPGS